MRRLEHPALAQVSLADVLSALGDPVRLRIVAVLSDGREHLQPDFDVKVSQATLSHHMKVLRQAGIVFSRPEGTRCFVSLRAELDDHFPDVLASVIRASERPR